MCLSFNGEDNPVEGVRRGSNPFGYTNLFIAGVYQWLDSDIANVKAVGSTPITRSKFLQIFATFLIFIRIMTYERNNKIQPEVLQEG